MLRILVKGEIHSYAERYKKASKHYDAMKPYLKAFEVSIGSTSSAAHIKLFEKYDPDVVFLEKTFGRSEILRYLEEQKIPRYDIDTSKYYTKTTELLREMSTAGVELDVRVFNKLGLMGVYKGEPKRRYKKEFYDAIDFLKEQLKEENIYDGKNKRRIKKLIAIFETAEPLPPPVDRGDLKEHLMPVYKLRGELKKDLMASLCSEHSKAIKYYCRKRSEEMYKEAVRLIKKHGYKRPYMIVGQKHAEELKDMHSFRVKLV